jgi:predicted 2-oxoglutarate/Fe(II)-dependent dioxygenase YbiX
MSKIITIKNFLSENECSNIIKNSLSDSTLSDAQVGIGDDYGFISEMRKSKISWMGDMDVIGNKLKDTLKENIKIKGIDTTNLYNFQFTQYTSGDYFDWHTDSSHIMWPGRYYTCIILLNNDYKGGELEIKENVGNFIVEKNVGDLILFPSTYMHRVLPVLDGVRYTLVNWVIVDYANTKSKTII